MIRHLPNGNSHEADLPTPYEILSRSLHFGNHDQERWWKETGPILADALEVAEYPVHLQYQHLLFYYRHALPALGPYTPPTIEQVKSIIPNGAKFELSVNFQNDTSTVRFDLDPTSHLAGTERDPFNEVMTSQMLSRLAEDGGKSNNLLYHHFYNELSLSARDMSVLQGQDAGLPISQTLAAWDLRGGAYVLKMYWFALLKSAATGISAGKLVLDAVGKVKNTQESGAFTMLKEYLVERESLDKTCLVSWDCVDPCSARLKVYNVEPDVTWTRVLDMWTLGGRLKSPATSKGIELLKLLWDCLEIPDGSHPFFDWDRPKQGEGRAAMMMNWELHPGASVPEPKVYIPVVGEIDLQVAQRLSKFFDHIGWARLASSYTNSLCSIFSHVDLSVSDRVITCISFAYSEKNGPYLTAYYYTTMSYPFPGARNISTE
ncbi:aromatic prenyltransferase [Aspergillus floccosus]